MVDMRLHDEVYPDANARSTIEAVVRFASGPVNFILTVLSSYAELGKRLAAYAILIALELLMRGGRNYARRPLPIIFGGRGILSLTFEPVEWLADGGQVSTFLAGADPAVRTMIASRVAHILFVIVALALAYGRSARGYVSPERKASHSRG